MMKIACVLSPEFEDSEFTEPYEAFRSAGNEVTIVGLEAGARFEGDKGKVKATVDRSFKDVKPDQFDPVVTSRQPPAIPVFTRESLGVLEQVPVGR
jgi:protease I